MAINCNGANVRPGDMIAGEGNGLASPGPTSDRDPVGEGDAVASCLGVGMQDGLIGIDWGTSTLRAYLMTGAGEIRDTVVKAAGILHVPDGDFERVFEECVGPWLAPGGDIAVIACGMIGSRQGWVEAPYVSCPAGTSELAANLTPVRTRSGATLWLVPGIMRLDENGIPDVARGEETQMIGSLEANDVGEHLFVLPGTHTKWAIARDGRITWFATFMTGELFGLLCRHSILGRLMEDGGDDAEAFRRGRGRAAQDAGGSGGLLNRLFSVRTLGLFGEVPKTGLRSYLSGLLIGSEIGAAKEVLGAELGGSPGPVTVIGGSGLAAQYSEALRLFGLGCATLGEEVAALGLARIATAAELDGRDR